MMKPAFNVNVIEPVNIAGNGKWSEDIEELFLLSVNGRQETISLHDYKRLYSLPGLYDYILNHILKCTSQEVVADMLADLVKSEGLRLHAMKILDFAAGNGLVAQAIQKKGGRRFIAADIEPEAQKSAERDRPGLYEAYKLLDFRTISANERQFFIDQQLDALVVASALGFGEKHVPVEAFATALDLVQKGGAIVFCIYDQYLSETDTTGYRKFLEDLRHGYLNIFEERRYVHRVTTYGAKIWYKAISGIKKQE